MVLEVKLDLSVCAKQTAYDMPPANSDPLARMKSHRASQAAAWSGSNRFRLDKASVKNRRRKCPGQGYCV